MVGRKGLVYRRDILFPRGSEIANSDEYIGARIKTNCHESLGMRFVVARDRVVEGGKLWGGKLSYPRW